jgi:phosphoribosyl-AMP cyclohydrolase
MIPSGKPQGSIPTHPDSGRAQPMAVSEMFANLVPVLKWTSDGLIPAIIQESETGAVLMMAWMNEQALRKTLETGQTHFYSRSRKKAWHKGETSGHIQTVEAIFVDCDADVLLIKVRQVGGACHKGYHSCFFRRIDAEGRLQVIAKTVFEAESVYAGLARANPPAADRSEG